MKVPTKLPGALVFGILLGIAAPAEAHHGNSEAPAPPSWNAYLPPGIPQPAQPAAPGR